MPNPLQAISLGADVRRNWVEINKQRDWILAQERRLQAVENIIFGGRERRDIGGGGELTRFAITTVFGDYVVGSKVNSSGAIVPNTTTNIAKPPWLRVSTFSGKTIGSWLYPVNAATSNTRTATYVGTPVDGGLQSGDQQGETLEPGYATTDTELLAMEVGSVTGVVVNGVALTWIDVNVSARHWRAVRTALNVCRLENGVQTQRRIVVDGGPVF